MRAAVRPVVGVPPSRAGGTARLRGTARGRARHSGSAAGYAGAVSVSRRRVGFPLGRPAPASVRAAGLIVAVQGAAALVVAVVLLIRALSGADQRVANGFGTAGWFVLVGGGVLAAGYALLAGRRWGRGLAVFAELLLLPVAYYLTVGSHRAPIGIPVAIMALAVLALLFSPTAIRWASGPSGADQPGPASSANSDPDSR
jgi:hypothetical protein